MNDNENEVARVESSELFSPLYTVKDNENEVARVESSELVMVPSNTYWTKIAENRKRV